MAAIHLLNNRRASTFDDALSEEEKSAAGIGDGGDGGGDSASGFDARSGRRQITQIVSTAPAVSLIQRHYRRAADSFAIDSDGIVHIWNGIDRPLRFDPSFGSFELAGVLPPLDKPYIGQSGYGNIVGKFYAYVRFIDRSGNFSSLSPISDPREVESAQASVTGATFASPVVITSSLISSMGDGQIVKVSEVVTSATSANHPSAVNGIYAIRKLTSTTAELYADSSLTVPISGDGAYVSGGKIRTGVSAIIYSNVAIPTEEKVVRRQILRNQDGSLAVFYVDIDTEDLTSTVFFSNTDSNSLTNSVTLDDTNGHSLIDKTVPMSHKRFVCFHRGRLFAGGGVAYMEGAVSVTNGSPNVTGICTEWGVDTFVDRVFEVQGDTKQYRIDQMISETSLILTEPYEGATAPYSRYSIHNGEGERRTIYWSEAGDQSGAMAVEAWPITNSITVSEDPQAGEVTGLMPMRSYIYINCEMRLFRFSFVADPLLDGDLVPSVARGCVNNRCWVQIEGIAYCLDYLGFHAFSGNDDQDIGTPAIQDLFRQQPSGPYKINWTARDNFHSCYSTGDGTIRWFVTLNGADIPQHAICYNIRLKRWWIEEYAFPVGASCMGRIRRQPQIFLGLSARRYMASGNSTLDGIVADYGTVRGNVTSASIASFTDSLATFPVVVGLSVTIVRGKGKGQERIVSSIDGTTIYLTEPWLEVPDTTSVYQLAAIGWRWRSGWIRWAESESNSFRAIHLQYKPQPTISEMHMRLYRDMAIAAQEWERPVRTIDENGVGFLAENPATDLTIDPTREDGYITQRCDGFRQYVTAANRFVAIELGGYSNADQTTVFGIRVDGAQQ